MRNNICYKYICNPDTNQERFKKIIMFLFFKVKRLHHVINLNALAGNLMKDVVGSYIYYINNHQGKNKIVNRHKVTNNYIYIQNVYQHINDIIRTSTVKLYKH